MTTDTTTETPAADAQPAAADQSLLATTPAAADPGPNDWMPEKYRVSNDAGEFDEAASSRKLADAYRSLESKLGKGAAMTVPETAEGYKIEAPVGEDGKPVPGIDIEAFVADPMFKGLAAKAHKAGMSNEHLQLMVQEYLQLAPSLFAADKAMTVKEASAELSKVWTDEATFEKNIALADRTVAEFTKDIAADQPGSFERLTAKLKNDPDFAAFVARIGGEVKFGEDTPIRPDASNSAANIESLMKGEAYWNAQHPDHTKVKQQVDAHFAKTYGTAAHR